VSIAAEVGEEVVAAAVYDVAADELFSAQRGGGATRDGEPISPSATVELGQALVGTGFSYEPERRRRQAQVLVRVLPRVRDIRRQGAAALDLCSVACGRLDAYYERGLAPWDLAAGGLIAREAGAVVSGLTGGPPTAGAVLAATPGVADDLQALLAETDAATA
jgi:myo-inositol-1(or 4)-monophosphatase